MKEHIQKIKNYFYKKELDKKVLVTKIINQKEKQIFKDTEIDIYEMKENAKKQKQKFHYIIDDLTNFL